MKQSYKPANYNSASPYFIVKDAEHFAELMNKIFNSEVLRRYDRPDGSIMHGELMIDDSVIMFSEATEEYPPARVIMHVYVPDVDATFEKAISAGCEVVERPREREGDPDRRGSFTDADGNHWSIGTQVSTDLPGKNEDV